MVITIQTQKSKQGTRKYVYFYERDGTGHKGICCGNMDKPDSMKKARKKQTKQNKERHASIIDDLLKYSDTENDSLQALQNHMARHVKQYKNPNVQKALKLIRWFFHYFGRRKFSGLLSFRIIHV